MKAVPALRARMGSTTYYQTVLTARELTATARAASESDKWASASIEERIQRELDFKRIQTELVPYLAKHPDRFWGSLIILVTNGSVEFEALTEVVGKVPGAYRSAVDSMGFLTVERGEHIALDGQHRLRALRDVITASEYLGEEQGKVGDDGVSVLVIEFETNEKTRRIFNKVNRHAKPTGRADNILLSEDDGYAIVTRMLLDADRDAPLAPIEQDGKAPQWLVNWKSNTLSRRVKDLTTISAVYETVLDIMKFSGYDDWEEKKLQVRPSPEQLDEAYAIPAEWWQKMLTKLDAFNNALADLSTVTEVRFAEDPPYHEHTLLLRPVGQIALVKGVIAAIANSKGKLTLDEALRRVNQLNWSVSPTSYWRGTIIREGGRMVARAEAYNLAAKLIAYLIGDEYLTDGQRTLLWSEWNTARDKDVTSQLADIEPELQPEDLPTPVS
jgi:DNA sulfur modification protein DndB